MDIALADSVAAWSVWEVADYVATGHAPGPLGTAHRLAAPYQAFDCADGKTLVIGAVNRSWPPLCSALGLDLSEDERFTTEYQRFRHRTDLAELLQKRFVTQPRDHWIAVLRDAGVPCGPVNSIDVMLTDPQFLARGMFPHDPEQHGEPAIVNTPVIADGAPRARGRAPILGQSAPAVLTELGYAPADIRRLADEGVIAGPVSDPEEAE